MVFRSAYSTINSIKDVEKIIKPALIHQKKFDYMVMISEKEKLWQDNEPETIDISLNVDRVYYINYERVSDQLNPELFQVEQSGDSYDIIGRLIHNETYIYFQYKVELYYENFSKPMAGFLFLSKDVNMFMRCVLRHEKWINVEVVLKLLSDDNILIKWPLDDEYTVDDWDYETHLQSDEWQRHTSEADIYNHKHIFRKNQKQRRKLNPIQPPLNQPDVPQTMTNEIKCKDDLSKVDVLLTQQKTFQRFGVRDVTPGMTAEDYRNFHIDIQNVDHIYYFKMDCSNTEDNNLKKTHYDFAGRIRNKSDRVYFYMMATTHVNHSLKQCNWTGQIFLSKCPNTFRDMMWHWKSSEPVMWQHLTMLYNRDSIRDTRTKKLFDEITNGTHV